MDKIIEKFNLYDHIGYVLVGFYQSILLAILYFVLCNNFFIPQDIGLLSVTFLFLSFYLIGHIVQAMSNLFVKEDKSNNNDSFKRIFDKCRKMFDLPDNIEGKHLFNYCYLYSLSRDETNHIQIFNSMYSLYRGLFTANCLVVTLSSVYLICWILCLYLNISDKFCDLRFTMIPFLIINVFLAYLFEKRLRRFYEYVGEKVFIIFDMLTKDFQG